MGLTDVIQSIIKVGNAFKDEAISAKVKTMYGIAEAYDFIGEKEIYEVMKKRCIEEYVRISDPILKQDVESTIKKYLP